MTARERLAAALVKSALSYEQAPEEDVARLLAADPTLEADLELGAAWRESEAALPEGWDGPEIRPMPRGTWMALAWNDEASTTRGPRCATPALALRAFAEALRSRS